MLQTPGGELRYLHIKKKGTAPKCGVCEILASIAAIFLTVSRTAVPSSPVSLPSDPANMPPSPAPRRLSSVRTVDRDAPTASRTVSSALS